MICFPCFLSPLNIKIERAIIRFSHSGIKNQKPFSEVALQTRESLKRPYFPLPLSILAGTNLIMLLLLLFFCNPRLIPKKIHPPFDFRENSSSFDFRENPRKTPKENQKNCFFFGSLCFLDLFQGYLSVHMGNIKGCDDVFRVSQELGMSVSWRGNPDGLCDGTFCALFHKQLWLQP